MKRKGKLVRYFNEQSGHCAYCNTEMTLELHKPNTAEVEHVIPRAKGGKKKAYNEVAACHTCNHDKADSHVGEWLRRKVGEWNGSELKQALIRFDNYA